MNKNALVFPSAVVLFCASNACVAGDINFYGKANLSLNSLEQESQAIDEWQLNSNASRLGVKGTHTINDGLTAIFKMEYEVSVDDGDKDGSTFSQRNIYAGLKGQWGALIAGRHDTPLKLAQGKIDRFNDLVLGDIKQYVEGEDRVSNLIMYSSPSVNGFSLTAAVVPGENSNDSDDKVKPQADGLADGISASINYSNAWLTAALAHNEDIDLQDVTRLVADFNMDKIKLGLLVQSAEDSDGNDDEDSWLVSFESDVLAGASFEGLRLKAQYGVTDYSTGRKDTQMALGVDKKLDKNNKVFVYYASVEQDQLQEKLEDSTIAVGYELKF